MTNNSKYFRILRKLFCHIFYIFLIILVILYDKF